MKKWISKYWRWLIGAPIILAVISFFSKLLRPKPYAPAPTREEADKKHAEVEKEMKRSLDAIDAEIDKDVERIFEKFGRR